MFSLESPHRGDSNEHTQYTTFQYKKENQPKLLYISSYGIFSKVVNEPSVFEPLKIYCIHVSTALITCFCAAHQAKNKQIHGVSQDQTAHVYRLASSVSVHTDVFTV